MVPDDPQLGCWGHGRPTGTTASADVDYFANDGWSKGETFAPTSA